MATPSEKLARSLDVLREAQNNNQSVVVRTNDISRTHRERLMANGFLREIIKGWYIVTRPDEAIQGSTGWYSSFWAFCSEYFSHRFGDDWCLSPEQSLFIHCENFTIPRQLLVRSPKGKNNKINLPNNISIFEIEASPSSGEDIEQKNGLNILSLPAALTGCSPKFFSKNSIEAETALNCIKDSSDLLTRLLEGGHSKIAGRLAGAFRNIGRKAIADEIIKTMKSAGYDVREHNPFTEKPVYRLSKHIENPYACRIKSMWHHMRQYVIDNFPEPKGPPPDPDQYMKNIEEIYSTDAYHSLSIEGFVVTPELIKKIKGGKWRPEKNKTDAEYRNALTARGYWQAFQSVKESIQKIFDGKNPGAVAKSDHGTWYREMLGPFVKAGLLEPSHLAGYRSSQVYIRGSRHVPPNFESVRNAMPLFFELLSEEKKPQVRALLGHFIFVFIHPYMDGNGRIGRFLMNAMLASGGYPWTVIPVNKRDAYMNALEKASVDNDIGPLTRFVGGLVKKSLGKSSR